MHMSGVVPKVPQAELHFMTVALPFAQATENSAGDFTPTAKLELGPTSPGYSAEQAVGALNCWLSHSPNGQLIPEHSVTGPVG